MGASYRQWLDARCRRNAEYHQPAEGGYVGYGWVTVNQYQGDGAAERLKCNNVHYGKAGNNEPPEQR